MSFEMKPLPFALDALEPHISKVTMETHYGKHYKTYIDKTNEILGSMKGPLGSRGPGNSLEEIILSLKEDPLDPLFQNAAQAWNHEFYWDSLSPSPTAPGQKTSNLIQNSYGDLDKLKVHFSEEALKSFGSGWVWLLSGRTGLTIQATHDANNPLGKIYKPVLVMDMWEHAYYLDRKNDKKAYIDAFWKVANWNFVEKNL